MDRISAMHMFVRVVETGSFSAVARELGMTQPTVSKNVAELEEWLGTKLLSRSTRQLRLTESGADYYERCVTILQDIEAAEQSIGQLQTQVKGTIKVNTPVAFGRLHIVPLLGDFFEKYADISVELSLSDYNIDLVETGVDLVLRMGDLDDSALIAKKLTASPMVTVASKRYFETMGVPEHPRDLRRHRCVIYTGPRDSHAIEYQEEGQPLSVRVSGSFMTNNSESLREGLLQGYGIQMVPKWLVGDLLETGKLMSVLDDYAPGPLNIYTVFLPGKHVPTKVRCFIEFLSERLANCQLIA